MSTCRVQIPERPTVSAIIVVLNSLVQQLAKYDRNLPVSRLKIDVADKSVKVEIKDDTVVGEQKRLI